jgi:hypothetical protein
MPGDWGCPPIFPSPPRLGEPEGVEKQLINNLGFREFTKSFESSQNRFN